MAAITPDAVNLPSIDSVTGQKSSVISGLFAGSAILACAPVMISADGGVDPSDGTIVHGISPRAAALGEPVSIYGPGVRFRYAASGLTPGAAAFAAAAGGWDDAAGASVGVAVSATDIQLLSVNN